MKSNISIVDESSTLENIDCFNAMKNISTPAPNDPLVVIFESGCCSLMDIDIQVSRSIRGKGE